MAKRKNKIDQIKKDLKSEIVKEEAVESPAVDEPVNQKPGEDSIPGDPPSAPALTKEGILALLELPFSMGRIITGSESFRIGEALREELGTRGLQLAKDYGIEFATKTMNLMIFAILYGGSLAGATAGYYKELKSNAKTKTKPVESGQDPSDRPGAIGKDNPDNSPSPAWN